jgi:integrase
VVKGTISKGHRDNAVSWLNDLCQYCGALPVGQLKKGQITTWLESHTTWRSPATHRGVISVVQAAFNRAEELCNVANPLKGLKKPPSKPRLHSFSEQDEQAVYGATEPCFGNFLLTLIHTGLRPFCELARITADDVEETARGMMWRVDSSKNKKTRKIPVRPEVAALTRGLMKTAPRGSRIPLFRNTKGRAWKRMTGVVRFLMIKKKLGWEADPVKTQYSCYTCRHTFAHRMLSGYWTGGVGCSIETLAELMGDTPKVAFDHYGKEWGQHYQDPLWAAIGEGSKGPARAAQDRGKSQKAKALGSKDRSRSDRSGSKRKKRGPKSTARGRGRTSR